MASTPISVAFHVVRVLLVLLLAIIFVFSLYYFIKAIDAIGDDVDVARETHFGHEVEEDGLEVEKEGKYDPYEDYYDEFEVRPKGRLIKGQHRFRITNSKHKHQHIISLIVWVVLTLFASILSLAGILGVLCHNPFMVIFCACMILVHAVCSHVLPLFHITLPNLTNNWFLLWLEVPAILLAIAFVAIYRAHNKERFERHRRSRILYN